jgi:hypothetical protein
MWYSMLKVTSVTPECQFHRSNTVQGETAQSHCSNTSLLLHVHRTDTRHKLARPCRDTGQTSESQCWGQLGRKNENSAYRQSAQRGIRLFKVRKHQSKAALFKHITLFLRTCSTADCNTREIHCPPPCVWGCALTWHQQGSKGPGTVRHCVTLGSASAPTLALPVFMACASSRRQ